MSPNGSWSRGRHSVVIVVASVVLLSAVVGATALTGAASSSAGAASSASPHDNGIGANYTVSLPNERSRQPGATGADIRHYAASGGLFEETASPDGFKRMDTLTIWSEDIVFGSCSTENTRAFGIDRDNDNSGTKTDEGLLQHRKDSAFNEHSIYVNFYGEGSIAGSPVELHDEDEIVAAQNGCYGMPSEPGWYQINARINGTGFNGNYIDSADQGTIRSHYFYVCDCASEQEAREKLGPPPSEEGESDDSGGGSDGSGDTGESTATPTATGGDSGERTATPTSTDGSATPTEGGSGDTDERTPTPTSADGGDTATATPSDRGGAETPTATSGADTTAAGSATATPTAAGTTTTAGGGTTGGGTADDGTGGDQSPAGTSGTPTQGSGPGFGVVATLAAVLGAVLLGARRSG